MPRILLIDDDPAIRVALARLLTYDGHSVTTAENGDKGLRLVEAQRVDLVITDVVMPEVDGLEFLIRLRRMESPPPVIVLSGGGSQLVTPYLDLAVQFGAAAVLTKPVVLSEMREHIARLTI